MREHPILFSGPMVRALLAGTKTQTRRAVKPQPAAGQGMVNAAYCGDRHLWLRDGPCDETDPAKQWRCPYGQPGDRLWVRETWQGPLMSSEEWEKHYFSEADEIPANFLTTAYCQYAADGGPAPEFTTMDDEIVARWKPSIHMPRWASRITLEITGVRAERLLDISDADAIAEGSFTWAAEQDTPVRDLDEARLVYRQLWEEINGPGSWDANPWVWVVEFERAQFRETDASGCKRTGTDPQALQKGQTQ